MSETKKILVIDDDADLVQSVAAYLGSRGYAVRTASNGTEGMERLQAERPDLIVLDIMMDYDAEGFNLAYRLHEDPETRAIPIVIVSGFGEHLADKFSSFDFVLGRDWPAAELLEKPVDLGRLAGVIARLLASGEGAAN